eukprot:CAMPEP_0114981450 /NCGR_PEP_ID=MMETSP0216-20121206/5549_1 /TAXON_ID=223996 /ORGANISM="Protocruzia adherens, Strain Boccale" /LENGTH=156 /DNA_ID=CAMNT_0002343119 /DNA_START=44 /DNA_END=514 /DNA_ORIENTATION=-
MDDDKKKLIVKWAVVGSSGLVFVTGLMNFFRSSNYLYHLICIYLLIFSVLAVLLELMPDSLTEILQKIFPFLETYAGRGMFFIILGTFCVGGDMDTLGNIAGSFIIISGAMCLACHWMDLSPQEETPTEDKDLTQTQRSEIYASSSYRPPDFYMAD